jgi:hypothetical protein
MTTELKINNAITKSTILFFTNKSQVQSLEISIEDFDQVSSVLIDIEKNEAIQIISFLQNHFNL